MIFKILFRIIKRYWIKYYKLVFVAFFLNIILVASESLSVLLLPKLINYQSSFKYIKSYLLFFDNLSLNSYLLIFTLFYIFILVIIFFSRNLSLLYSSKFANRISIEYSQDFIQSFSKQGLDEFNKFSKDKLNTYIQAKFPLISREVFFP